MSDSQERYESKFAKFMKTKAHRNGAGAGETRHDKRGSTILSRGPVGESSLQMGK